MLVITALEKLLCVVVQNILKNIFRELGSPVKRAVGIVNVNVLSRHGFKHAFSVKNEVHIPFARAVTPPIAVKFALYKEVIPAAGQLGGYAYGLGQLAGQPYSVSVNLDNVPGNDVVPAAYFSAVTNFHSVKIAAALYGVFFHLSAEKRLVLGFNGYGYGLFIAGYAAYLKSAVKDKGKRGNAFVKVNFRFRKKLFALETDINFHFGHFFNPFIIKRPL